MTKKKNTKWCENNVTRAWELENIWHRTPDECPIHWAMRTREEPGHLTEFLYDTHLLPPAGFSSEYAVQCKSWFVVTAFPVSVVPHLPNPPPPLPSFKQYNLKLSSLSGEFFKYCIRKQEIMVELKVTDFAQPLTNLWQSLKVH